MMRPFVSWLFITPTLHILMGVNNLSDCQYARSLRDKCGPKNPLIHLPVSSQSAEKFNLFIITLQGCSVSELLFNDTNTLSD